MQLSMNTYTPNFKALMISPSGMAAADSSLMRFVQEEQKKRINDKYVDAVITAVPDGDGEYFPVLHVKDKLTGEYFRGIFNVTSSHGHFGYNPCYSKDGQLLPEDVVMITDSKGKTRYFTFNDPTEAGRFMNGIENDNHLNMQLGLPRMLEEYYRDSFETGKLSRDKYAELVVKLKKEYGKPFEQVVPDIIKQENLLGQGREKDVYKIDKMPDYVLCVSRDKFNSDEPVKPFHQCFQSNSITEKDEPIMMNDCMYIKKFTGGKSHSLPDWYNKFHGKEPVVYDDINLFISQLEELNTFPTKSYVNFAKELQKFSKNRVRIDTVNPNNLLIDSDAKTIRMIDVSSDDSKVPNGVFRPINSLVDMEVLLLDSMMYTTYHKLATDKDKEKLDNLAKAIMKKCEIAEKVTNLGNYTRNTRMYLEDVDKRIPFDNGGTRSDRLEEFFNHFDGFISHELKDPKEEFDKNIFGYKYHS